MGEVCVRLANAMQPIFWRNPRDVARMAAFGVRRRCMSDIPRNPTIVMSAALLLAGCVQVPTAGERTARPYQVKTEGSCVELKQTAPLTPDQFLRKFDDHWTAGRKVSAASLARRFPDIGVAALQARDSRTPATAAEQALAGMLDQMTANGSRFPERPVRIALVRAEAERRQ